MEIVREEWRLVSGTAYEVSTLGRVRRDGRFLKPYEDKGYLRIGIFVDGIKRISRVHRLVAEAFIGPCPLGMEINHKDCNPLNNSLENLEYVTHTENIRYAWKMGRKSHQGEKHPVSKLTNQDVLEIRSQAASGRSDNAIARERGIGKTTVRKIRRRQAWSHVA